MKRTVITTIFLIAAVVIYGQIEKQFKALQLNSSPAYVILGVEPENIQRPNSPSDFVAGVQSAIVNDKLQPNFAIESTPYYWSRRKPDDQRFNVVDYITNNNWGSNVLKSFTFSFASSESDTTTFGNMKPGTGLGIGFHLQLAHGKVSNIVFDNLLAWFYQTRMQVLLESIISKLEAQNNNFIDDVDSWLDERLSEGSLKDIPLKEKEVIKRLLTSKLNKSSLQGSDLSLVRRIRNQVKKKSENKLSSVNEYQFPLTREGFMLEFAFAHASIAEESKWNNLKGAKTGIWLTPSYRFNINKDPQLIDMIDIMGVYRLMFNNELVDISDYFDAGLKLQWTHNRLNLSAESVIRWLTKKPEDQEKGHTWRNDLSFSYKVNELITFKVTFGSNFDGNSTTYSDPNKMFAVGGFNFGFSNFFKKQDTPGD